MIAARRPELLGPVEPGERRRVGHADRRHVRAATRVEVALVHAVRPGLAGQRPTKARIAVAVVGEEEQALDGQQQDSGGQAGDGGREERVRRGSGTTALDGGSIARWRSSRSITPDGRAKSQMSGSIGMISRKLTPIVSAIPIPTYAARTAPRSAIRFTSPSRPPPVRGRGARATGHPRAPGARIPRTVAELALDPQQAVVLGDTLRAGRRAGLDLARPHRDDEVRDRRVLGLAGAMRHHRGPAGAARELDRLDGLGERPDLVELDQDRIRRIDFDGAGDPLRVRHEQVVADELDRRRAGRSGPASRTSHPRPGRPRSRRSGSARPSRPTGRSARPSRASVPRGPARSASGHHPRHCPARPARSWPDRARWRYRCRADSLPSRSRAGSPRPPPGSMPATARTRPRRPVRSRAPRRGGSSGVRGRPRSRPGGRHRTWPRRPA